jgi:hypothetical protein
MYEERDLSVGQQMVECFKPFLRHLLSSGPSCRAPIKVRQQRQSG